MKKIACVGYNATGAGVIDDLFREFDNVSQGFYEAECRVLQDGDGVSDLEYHLVENPHRLKIGLAIERFLRYAKDNRREYEKTFGDQWLQMCQDYIDSLIKFRFKGYYTRWLLTRSDKYKYLLLLKKVANRLRPKRYRHPTWWNYFPNETAYHALPTKEEFLEKTQVYFEGLCQLMNQDNKEFVVIDQMVPGNYTERYLRYVKDAKIIVVDRDPRDLYIHEFVVNDHALPREPQLFCVHYRDIRVPKGVEESSVVLRIRFEDMIYHYDETVKKVLDFVSISPSHHISPRTHFIPEKSMKNTQMWKTRPEFVEAVKIIEKELPEYLYPFE